MKRFITAAAITASTIVVIAAAQDVPPSFVGSSTELVILPVTVTDGRGGFVEALPRHRFSVFDNGRRQEITLFDDSDTPVTVGLIVDSSGSMGPKLADVVAATLVLARSSNPDDEFFMVGFNDTVRAPAAGPLTLDVVALEAEMHALQPRGRTALYDALMVGLERLALGTRTRKALVVISDGGDNASRHTLDDVLRAARKSGVTLFTIGVFDSDDTDKNPTVLQTLAESSGGQRFLPKSPMLLMSACTAIARELRSGYLLGYAPPDRDGAYHQVRVTLAREDRRSLRVRTRPGYLASAPDSRR